MPPLLLRVTVVDIGVTKSLHFDKSMTVFDACRYVNKKIHANNADLAKQVEKTHGLFLPNVNPTEGIWLDSGESLDSFHFKPGTVLEYRSRLRAVSVCTLDGAMRRIFVDDSHCISDITRAVCARIGIQNPQEFSFTVDDEAGISSLKKTDKVERDKKLETLRREKHTHDLLQWINPKLTLRKQGLVNESTVLTLRKKFFFTDKNVDANDPVQLHLLYTQSYEAIANGEHPVPQSESMTLAALRCQEMYGDYVEGKYQNSFFRSVLRDLLPCEYKRDSRKLVDGLIIEYKKLTGKNEQEMKFRYVEKCRKLSTYGISFFAIKEKVYRQNKLHAVLLGVKRESVIKMDVKSKEVVETWPLSTIYSYCSTPGSFFLNFGSYRGVYIAKTSEGEAIVQLLDGYIHLIQQDISHSSGSTSPSPSRKLSAGLNVSDPKENMTLVIANVIDIVSKLSANLDSTSHLEKKMTSTVKSTLHITSQKLRSSLNAFLYSSDCIMSEVSKEESNFTSVASAVCCIGRNMSSIVEFSQLLASHGLTEKDSARIVTATRGLLAVVVRLLSVLQEGQKALINIMLVLEDVGSRSSDLISVIGFKRDQDNAMIFKAAAPLLQDVGQSVSRLLSQSRRYIENYGMPDFEDELLSCTKNVKLSIQVLQSTFGIISSFIGSPVGQQRLVQAIKNVGECIQVLCTSFKSVSFDHTLLIEVASSASTVTSSLDRLLKVVGTKTLARQKHSLEVNFENILVESRIVRSQLKKQNQRKLLTHTKTFVESTKALMEDVMSYNDIHQIHVENELKASFRALSSINLNLVDTAKTLSKPLQEAAPVSDVQAKRIAEAVSTSYRLAGPFLDHIQEARFVSTTRSAADSSLMLALALRNTLGLEGSQYDPVMVKNVSMQCDNVLEKHLNILYSVLYDNGSSLQESERNYHRLLIATRDSMLPMKSLIVMMETVKNKLASSQAHEHVLMDLDFWSSLVSDRVIEVEMLLVKMKFHVPSRMLKSSMAAIKHEFQPTVDKTEVDHVMDKVLFQKYDDLVASCRLICSLTPQLLEGLSPVYTYHRIASEVQNILTFVLEIRGLKKCKEFSNSMLRLASKLLEQTEELSNQLVDHMEGNSKLKNQIQDTTSLFLGTINEIRSCLPLQSAIDSALKMLMTVVGVSNSTTPEEDVKSAFESITTFLFNLLMQSDWLLSNELTSVSNFVTNIKDFVSGSKSKLSVCKDVQGQSAISRNLRIMCNSIQRMLQIARDVCYNLHTCQTQLAPAVQLAVIAIGKFYLTINQSEHPEAERYEADIRNMKAWSLILDLDTEPSPFMSCLECTSNIAQQSEIIQVVSRSLKNSENENTVEAVRGIAGTVSHAVSVIAESAHQVASMSAITTEKAVADYHYYHITSIQFRVASHKFLQDCDEIMDVTLTEEQLSLMMNMLSKENTSMYSALRFLASHLPAPRKRKLLLKHLEILSKLIPIFLDNVRILHELKSEQSMSICKTQARGLSDKMDCLSDVLAIIENFKWITPTQPNEVIIKVTKETVHSTINLLMIARHILSGNNSPDLFLKLGDEVHSVTLLTQSLVETTQEQFLPNKQCQLLIDLLITLQGKLGTTAFEYEIQQTVNDTQTPEAEFKKVLVVCSQIQSQISALKFLPNLDIMGDQMCHIAQEFSGVSKSVLDLVSRLPISEHGQKIVQHTRTCLEILVDVLTKFKRISSSQRKDIETFANINLQFQHLELETSELMSTINIDPGIRRISEAMDKLNMPLVVVEDVDSSISLQITLLSRFESLANVVNATLLTNIKQEFPQLQCQIVNFYEEIIQISQTLFGADQMDDIVHSLLQSLGEALTDVLVSFGYLQLFPDIKTQLTSNIKMAASKVSQLKTVIQQSSEGGAEVSAINNINCLGKVIDTTLVIMTLRQQQQQQLALEETDFHKQSGAGKLSVQSISSMYLAISKLVELLQHEHEHLMEPISTALNSLVPLIIFVKENNLLLTSSINLTNLQATTAVRDVITSLTSIMLAAMNYTEQYHPRIVKWAEFAQSTSLLLLEAVQAEADHCHHAVQEYDNMFDSTMNYLDIILEMCTTCNLPKSTEEVLYYELVHSTTSLLYFSKILRQACQSVTVMTIMECVAISRITAAELFQVYCVISSKTEYQQSDVKTLMQECISLLREMINVLRKTSNLSANIDVIRKKSEEMNYSMEELLFIVEDYKRSTSTQNQPIESYILKRLDQHQSILTQDLDECTDGDSEIKCMSLEEVVIETRVKLGQFLQASLSHVAIEI